MNLITVTLKTGGGSLTTELPISHEELDMAREDFIRWVHDKAQGPLDGSWGSLMDWWMSERYEEWKRFDQIDRIHLKYAVGLPKNKVRVHG